MKEIVNLETSILFLKEKLQPGSFLFLDIDGTVKGPKTQEAPLGFDPELPASLHQLQNSGVMVGACTSQSPLELSSFLEERMGDTNLFTGVNILEDGHIVVMPGENIASECQVLASPEALQQIEALKKILKRLWQPAGTHDLASDGWGFFPSVATPIILPEGKYQGAVTMSIWEKGPDIHDPSYQGEYEPVRTYIDSVISSLGINGIDLVEAGNGTLRIVQKGLSKTSALEWLANQGVVELSRSIYIGDGLNDVEPATLIKQAGGGVVAVGNAITALKEIANYSCANLYSHGIIEVLRKVAHL
jgi:hydroxymethylpyrimidine pyrophosphatase-like HAD family hydrolase